MSDVLQKDIKKELRRKLLAMREEISSHEKVKIDRAICDAIVSLPEWKNATLVLVYASSRGEIDLSSLYAAAEEDGKAIAFPRCLPDRIMEFAVCGYDELSLGRFSIPEPPAVVPSLWEFPDDTLCILPCLAANSYGFRIGYGGGYYDRFLASHRITAVAALHHRFLINDTGFTEPFDIPADILITEKETIRIEK